MYKKILKLLKNSDLQKGAMKKKAPFNPQEEYEKDPEAQRTREKWLEHGGENPSEQRQQIPPMSTQARMRAIHKLHAHTDVRKNPSTGKKEFLLHRAMGSPEFTKVSRRNPSGKHILNYTEDFSSWTPHEQIAHEFIRHSSEGDIMGQYHHVVSSWIPEDKIHSIPKQYGETKYGGRQINKSPFSVEHEVIVSPHINRVSAFTSPKKLTKAENIITEESNHNEQVRNVADQYAKSKGLKLQHGLEKARVNPERAVKIAQAYHNMPHTPNHPKVKQSYDALIDETTDQFKHIMNSGLKISKIKPGMEPPYKTSKDMLKDVKNNNHMWFFPTESGFGSQKNTKDHPMLKPTDIQHEGKPLLANDVFRVVHDYFGHAKEGHQFGPHGEENAWRTHKQMYSPQAQGALTTETRGQNSWVNFGPKGQHNRLDPSKTVYAEQKAGLLPDWAYEHDEQNNQQPLRKSEKLSKPASMRDRLQQPHFIFSAENPLYPESQKIKMNHDQVVEFLKDRGYNVDSMAGKYGKPEKSILVYDPPKHAIKHLMKLSNNLGQESSIYSDGYNHEFHYNNGKSAGKHFKGQGTAFHKTPPEDYYSSLGDTHFTHNINFEEGYSPKDSMVSTKNDKLQKSEETSNLFLAKNESRHPLEYADPGTKLIHYSPYTDLKDIDPYYHGKRNIGEEIRRSGKPEHPMSFYYLENTEPEEIVVNNAKKKYITSLGNKKLYDVSKDPEGIYAKLKEQSKSKQVNPGIVSKDSFHKELKRAGFAGIYNSQLDPTMRNVVGIFHTMPIENSYDVHRKDRKLATTEDHHSIDDHLEDTKSWAKENSHHTPKFLHGLIRGFKK